MTSICCIKQHSIDRKDIDIMNLKLNNDEKAPVRINKHRIKIGTASALACSILLSSIPVTVFADETFDETIGTSFDGNFEEGAFSVWDGVSYDFSWYNPANETYYINSAAQLAALSILSNDLSSEEYDDFRSTLPSSIPAQYIENVVSFAGKTIELNTDIDLSGYSWLPISYPWNTPNVTNDDYDALGHIPANLTAVDSWVGDGAGSMINTRYLEYPESEMRYRDLIYAVTSTDGYTVTDGGTLTRKLATGDVASKKIFIASTSDVEDGFRATIPIKAYRSNPTLSGTDLDETLLTKDKCGALGYLYSYNTGVITDYADNGTPVIACYIDRALGSLQENSVYKGTEIHDTDIYMSYTYADVDGYADIDGFCGVFDGCGYCIKGLHPETPWTDDPTERITTYDPIGKGLFAYISTTGTVKNLNIKGEYTTNDVVSYSAFLCAYNYGTISNCYVYGDMEQGLVKQYYPVRRDYGANGTSVYEFSNEPGTVLPVGNSGFVTAINNGTILNCASAGSVKQAYRQFGFISCINNGTISNCRNTASFSTYEVETDFITDEWSYEYNMTENFDFSNSAYATADHILDNPTSGMNTFNAMYPDRENQSSGLSMYDWYVMGNNSYYDWYLKYIAAYMQGSASDGAPWVPGMYMPVEGESIAANHLYGVYGYTAVGGICAINNKNIINCENTGNITIMYNTSTRNQGKQYGQGEGTSEKDYLSYIRPGNAYGLFSTQTETINLAAGITALNTGNITACKNTGNISKRPITDRDKIFVEGSTFGLIAYTENGFYANDCIIYTTDTGTPTYNPMGTLWWFNEDNDGFEYTRTDHSFNGSLATGGTGANGADIPADPNIGTTFKTLPYLGNSPYPLYQKAFAEKAHKDEIYMESINVYSETATYQLTAGVCVDNIGTISDTINTGSAKAGITYISDGLNDVAILTGNIQNGNVEYNIGYYLRNTHLLNNNVTNKFGKYGVAYIASNENVSISQINTNVYEGASGYYMLYGDENERMTIAKIRLYDADLSGIGISKKAYNIDFSTIYNFQPSTNGISEIANCNIADAYMYAAAEYAGIGYGTVNSYLSNLNFYGSSAEYALGSFTNGSYTDLHVNTLQNNNIFGLCNHILTADNASIDNLTAFTDTDDLILDIINCDIKNTSIYGDTPEVTTDGEYRFLFSNSVCENMILQVDINIEWRNPNINKSTQYLPGVLKTVSDTNTFTDCVIQTPNGAVSYPTFNYQLDVDDTIKSDAILSYDPDARRSGALAYYMDNGDSDERTFDYTVAFNDTEDILAEIINDIEQDYVFSDSVRNLPAYTRKKTSASEKSYYRLSIPFISNGAGEVIGKITRNGNTYTTLATEQIFPVVDLFASTGESITLSVTEEPGYGMISWTKATSTEQTDMPYKRGKTETVTMGTEDIVILSEWSDLYEIEIEENPVVTITTNTTKSTSDQIIYVDTLLSDSSYEIDKVWYYKYKLDNSNRRVLDSSTKYEIDMETMCFEMPDTDVRIYVSLVGADVSVDRVILNGATAVIDNDARTINVVMENSTDLTNTYPEIFETTNTTDISPSPSVSQDFTKPVNYTLTAENGTKINYTLTVTATEDGKISYFEILGKSAAIDEDEHTINLQLSSDIDLSAVTPKIIWSGSSITPDGTVDLTARTMVYSVTNSIGTIANYTLTISTPESTEAIQEFYAKIPDLETVIWTINHDKKTISTIVPYGTCLSDCLITIIKWYGSGISLLEGTNAFLETGNASLSPDSIFTIEEELPINLTRSNYLTIKADNGDVETYTIYATESPSDTKRINQFTLYGRDGVIDEVNKTITVTIPAKYDITNIAPDIVSFTAKSITNPYEPRDFTQDVTYEVTAYDDTSVTYTVTVIHN